MFDIGAFFHLMGLSCLIFDDFDGFDECISLRKSAKQDTSYCCGQVYLINDFPFISTIGIRDDWCISFQILASTQRMRHRLKWMPYMSATISFDDSN